jgi:hypothetical protein
MRRIRPGLIGFALVTMAICASAQINPDLGAAALPASAQSVPSPGTASQPSAQANGAATVNIKNASGLEFLIQVLEHLGDPNAQLATQTCDISEKVTPSGGSATPVEWTVDADNYLMTAHTTTGVSQFGSRTPVTIHGKLYNLEPRMRLAHFEPAAASQWLARAVMRPTISISNVAQRSIDGKTLLAVQLADTTNSIIMSESRQVWYFDPNTSMPVRIDYKLPSITRSGLTAPTHVLIQSLQAFSGVLFPSAMSTYIGETPETTITVSSAACSAQLHSDSYFDVSRGNSQ